MPESKTKTETTSQVGDLTFSILLWVLSLGIPALLIYLAIRSSKAKADAEAARKRAIRERAQLFIDQVNRTKRLPTIQVSCLLKPDERAYFSEQVTLYETRAVRHSVGGFGGVRVAKGVFIGGSKGQSTSTQEWSKIAEGDLVVTNQRLIFDGDSSDRTIPLAKVFSVKRWEDAVEVSCEGRQKSMVFSCENPYLLVMVLRICGQVSDPGNLADARLDLGTI